MRDRAGPRGPLGGAGCIPRDRTWQSLTLQDIGGTASAFSTWGGSSEAGEHGGRGGCMWSYPAPGRGGASAI